MKTSLTNICKTISPINIKSFLRNCSFCRVGLRLFSRMMYRVHFIRKQEREIVEAGKGQ